MVSVGIRLAFAVNEEKRDESSLFTLSHVLVCTFWFGTQKRSTFLNCCTWGSSFSILFKCTNRSIKSELCLRVPLSLTLSPLSSSFVLLFLRFHLMCNRQRIKPTSKRKHNKLSKKLEKNRMYNVRMLEAMHSARWLDENYWLKNTEWSSSSSKNKSAIPKCFAFHFFLL